MRAIRTTLPSIHPFGFAGLAHDVDRFFQAVNGTPRAGERVLRNPRVRVDLWTTEDEVIVTAEVPGIPADALEITVTGDVLSIVGEKKAPEHAPESGFFERTFGTFEREIALPVAVDPSAVRAEHKDGVVTLHLPIANAVKPRRIELNAAPREAAE